MSYTNRNQSTLEAHENGSDRPQTSHSNYSASLQGAAATATTTPQVKHLRVSNSTTMVGASPALSTTSLKELKKNYHMRKKYFTKNVQSAIESTQEVHSGWLKARTNFKRWTKVWCQVKPGYLILYTSQEALKKHRLGVVLLSVCQVIKRPTKKEGFCFKLINPFGCSVWAKSSTKAIVFAQASLTLRVSDESIGRLWLDALHTCHLSSNLEGYQAVVDEDGFTRDTGSHRSGDMSDMSDDDADHSARHLESLMNHSNSTSDINSTASLRQNNNNNNNIINSNYNNINNLPIVSGQKQPAPLTNGGASANYYLNDRVAGGLAGTSASQLVHQTNHDNNSGRPAGEPRAPSSQTRELVGRMSDNSRITNNNNYMSQVPAARTSPSSARPTAGGPVATSGTASGGAQVKMGPGLSLNSTKMVAKFSKYHWRELQLEAVKYVEDGLEELGSAGMQSEEVHDSNKNLLWHIIKQVRPGMDLSKVTLPTFILEPRSFLEKLADYYYHCDILSEAALLDDPVERLINIVKWYLSGFYKKPKGPKKPYNPILGERFRCFWDHPKTKSRTFFVAEQVSHHPPISAFHVANRKDGFTISCALLSRSKYTGNSVSAILDGKARLCLTRRNETYILSMPYANCRGILLGSLCLELGGKVEIECLETGCKCELDFKLASMWASASSYNTLTGKILVGAAANKVTHTLEGHWDKRIEIVNKATDRRSVLWEVTEAVKSCRLKRYTVSAAEQEERESVRLWSKVTAALNEGNQLEATAEKTRLEDMQRKEARERQGAFKPQHFELVGAPSSHDFAYRWLDQRAWNERRDIMQFEEDFRIRTLMLDGADPTAAASPTDPRIDMPLTQLSKFAAQVKELVVDTQKAMEGRGAGGGLRGLSTSEFSPATIKSIESKIAAGNVLFEEAIKQVTEKNRKLEEDIALLKRAKGKRTLALLLTALIVAMISAYYGYFT